MIRSGLARTTINQRVGRVVHLFKWAVENELIPASVHHGLKAVAGLQKGRSDAREPDPIRPVPDDRVDPLRPHVAAQVWAMIELQRSTGMRPGEVLAMRSGDVDRSGATWTYTPAGHKTAHRGRGRSIHLGPRAQEVLRPWLKADPVAFLFSPSEAEDLRAAERRKKRRTPLTPSQRVRRPKASRKRAPRPRYDKRSYHNAIARGCDRAFPHPTLGAVPQKELSAEQSEELRAWRRKHRWHPHQLRHSAATRLRKEFGLDAARAVLGHSSPVVTEVYAELDSDKAAEVMGRIG